MVCSFWVYIHIDCCDINAAMPALYIQQLVNGVVKTVNGADTDTDTQTHRHTHTHTHTHTHLSYKQK